MSPFLPLNHTSNGFPDEGVDRALCEDYREMKVLTGLVRRELVQLVNNVPLFVHKCFEHRSFL